MTRKYEKYKSSGVEWIGEIPDHWEVRKLKRISQVKRGASPRPIDSPKYFDDNGEFGWVRISDVTKSDRYLFETEQYLSKLGVQHSVKMYPNDIFLSIAGSVGKAIITKVPCCIHDGFVWFKGLKIDTEFLFYIFQINKIYEGLGKEGTQLNLNTETIGSITIPFVNFTEQKKIVSYLDKKSEEINKFIKNKEGLINLLEEEKKAIITQAVTKGLDKNVKFKQSGADWLGEIPEHWETYRTKFLFSLITQPSSKNNNHELLSIYTDIGVKPRKELEEKGNKASSTDGYWLVKKGDFIVNKLLAWMGAIGLSEYDGVTSPAYDILRKNKSLDEYFYNYLFRCGVLLEEIKKHSKGIMEMRLRLYFTEFSKIFLVYPPLEEQQKIVSYLDEQTKIIDDLKAKYRQEIDLIKEYKERLIYDVVTGKMNVL